jgi:hypothetical protein
MTKTNLLSGQELIAEANRLKKIFFTMGTIWTLELCLDAVIENTTIETTKDAIDSARDLAKIYDKF